MKRWDSLIRKYEEVLISKNLVSTTITGRITELDRFGCLSRYSRMSSSKETPCMSSIRQ